MTTTDQGRVTTQDGTVIPGLYAAGEMSNRYFYNENYVLAASLGLYSTMGRRALAPLPLRTLWRNNLIPFVIERTPGGKKPSGGSSCRKSPPVAPFSDKQRPAQGKA